MLAEARRLPYVAITRAREPERLYNGPAVRSVTRSRFEHLSRFLTDKGVQHRLKVSVPDLALRTSTTIGGTRATHATPTRKKSGSR